MIFNKKSIQLISCSCVSLLLTPAPLDAQGITTKCSILRLQMHRTLATKISDNHCTTGTDLSLGTVIELEAGTRAWLEPVEKSKDNAGFQIVCLNKSSTLQKLKIASANFPWLVPLDMRSCGSWSVNRLTCKHPDNQHEILLCAIAPKLSPVVRRVVQPKTSVPVRGINRHSKPQPLSGPYNFSNNLAPGVNLCRQLLNTSQTVTLNWTISATGAVSQASIIEPGIDKQFSACVLDALLNTEFPAMARETQVKLLF